MDKITSPSRHADILRRIEHKQKSNSYDEEFWLDRLEFLLAEDMGIQIEITATTSVDMVAQFPKYWERFIAYSRTDAYSRRMLGLLLQKLLIEPESQEFAIARKSEAEWTDAVSKLNQWAQYNLYEKTPKKRRPGGDKQRNAVRNWYMVETISMITKLGGRPATSNTPGRSSCNAVEDRLKISGRSMSYEAVRTVWINGQDLLKRARDKGLAC